MGRSIAMTLACAAYCGIFGSAGLRAAAAGTAGSGIYRGETSPVDTTPVAWMFTGQGAQYAGMGRTLFDQQPVFREAIERADAALRPHLETSLVDVLYGASGASIDQTAPTTSGVSFAGFTAGGAMNINNLASIGANYGTIEGFGLPGNWAVRAVGDAIPEPTALSLLGLGGLALVRRRRA